MTRRWVVGAVPWLGVALLAWMAGCRSPEVSRSEKVAPLPDISPTALDYVDSDAFDRLLEASLVNHDPVIVIHTGFETADWGGRLNAWIAAWNRGGHTRSRTARGQAPVPKVTIDGDSIREFRLLVDGLLGRIEEAAQGGSTWYRDQRERSRRVALLRPYSLRFHKGEDATIQLIFFHQNYSAYYPRFVQKLMEMESLPPGEWTRSVECSECRSKGQRKDQLTGRGS